VPQATRTIAGDLATRCELTLTPGAASYAHAAVNPKSSPPPPINSFPSLSSYVQIEALEVHRRRRASVQVQSTLSPPPLNLAALK
jgi:hypothetical protein